MDAPLSTPPRLRLPKFAPSNTAENEIFALDEPSSVLASRIMRALDNPSPPPVSSSNMSLTNDTKLVDISEPTTPCYPNVQLPGHILSLLPTPHSPSLHCGLPSRRSPTQPHGDLITFDDEPTTTSDLIPSHCLRNTDDASELIKENSCKELEPLSILHSKTKEVEIPHYGDPSTPVRCSSGTSTCNTPHRTFPSIVSEGSHVQISSSIETMPQANNVWTKIRRKSAKTADIVEPQSPVKQHSIASELQKNDDISSAGHPRLNSLSPTSCHVLSQLIATSHNETPHSSKSPISTEFTQTTALQPVDSQETLLQEPTYTQSPQRLQLVEMSSKIAQVRTPARRILAGEAPPSKNKPFNTLASNHALDFCLPRTPISSSDSPAYRTTNATNKFGHTIPDKAFSAELLRISSPRRQLLDQSPSKNLSSTQFRTPARRIMTDEAPPFDSKRSNLFPQTVAFNNVRNFGVARNPMFRINSNDSPARRVTVNNTVIADSEHIKHDNTLPHSPIRGTAVRSHSEEPSTTKLIIKTRCNSVEPRPQPERLSSMSTDLSVPLPKLPFPLIPEAIPEEPVDEKCPVASSVLVSTLKQTTSKIPRIGTKPYARPTRSTTNKLSDPVQRVGPPKQTPSLPLSQPTRRNHNSDESTRKATFAHRTTNSFITGSKRKRILDDTFITSRVPTTLSNSMHDSITQQATRIMDDATMKLPNISIADKAHDKSDSSQPPTVVVNGTPEQSSSHAVTKEKRRLFSGDLTPVPGPSKMLASNSQPVETTEFNSTKTRRTTRSRTRATPTTTMMTSRSSLSKRRANKPTTFNNMSAVTLKALTNSNTIRNQQYIAAKIETEIIRKPGFRPTSPTVKMKTVLHQTQDEKGRERRERAQRRAQRSGEGSQNNCVDTRQQPESPTFVKLDLNIDHDTRDTGRCDGQRRDIGEDEDYQLPESKKRKVADGSEQSEARKGRRVKWDKGLYTEVRLDEIQLGARLLHNHPTVLKGCLAPTSKKAVQLDTMGNLPTASLPVEDLIEESVVVKKFVYDDDEEPSPPIALETRSNVKKNKVKV